MAPSKTLVTFSTLGCLMKLAPLVKGCYLALLKVLSINGTFFHDDGAKSHVYFLVCGGTFETAGGFGRSER